MYLSIRVSAFSSGETHPRKVQTRLETDPGFDNEGLPHVHLQSGTSLVCVSLGRHCVPRCVWKHVDLLSAVAVPWMGLLLTFSSP